MIYKLIVFIIFVLVVVGGWKMAFPTNSFRYKVTVNIQTPEGLKSGSAVREAKIYQQPEVGDSGPWVNVSGEAVAIDLGERGVVFAVMGKNDYILVYNTFPEGPPILTRKGARYYQQLRAKAIVELTYYPLLVAFQNIDDPKTIKVAYRPILERKFDNPGYVYKAVSAEDNMEKIFGKGVKLQSITVEMTEEDTTWKIEKHLPWLELVKGGYLDGKFSGGGPELENILHGGNFKVGGQK